jgi:hypothetical protein
MSLQSEQQLLPSEIRSIDAQNIGRQQTTTPSPKPDITKRKDLTCISYNFGVKHSQSFIRILRKGISKVFLNILLYCITDKTMYAYSVYFNLLVNIYIHNKRKKNLQNNFPQHFYRFE